MSRFAPLASYNQLDFAYDADSGFYAARIPVGKPLDGNTDYAVLYHGKLYTCKPVGNGLGNAFLYDQRKADTGEPFFVSPALGMVLTSTPGRHQIAYGTIKSADAPVDERVEEIEREVDRLSEDKVALPQVDGTPSPGIAGQFAVSDGNGGIAWKTLVEAEEVSY